MSHSAADMPAGSEHTHRGTDVVKRSPVVTMMSRCLSPHPSDYKERQAFFCSDTVPLPLVPTFPEAQPSTLSLQSLPLMFFFPEALSLVPCLKHSPPRCPLHSLPLVPFFPEALPLVPFLPEAHPSTLSVQSLP